MFNDAPRMPFGKYHGVPLKDIPDAYLFWVLDNLTKISPTLKESIYARLGIKKPENGSANGTGHQRPEIMSVVGRWRREITFKWHPDRGGNTQVMQALNDAIDRLESLLKDAVS
jgi:hypothetical protein